MESIRSIVSEIIESEEFPKIGEDFLGYFLDDERVLFSEEECVLWDYKQEFPHSRSDNYCAGIVKSICAFHNTYGGLLIFGVHDEKRTGGHNKVVINIESFNSFLGTVVSKPIECRHKKFILNNQSGPECAVDILLIPKRPSAASPVFLSKEITNKYREGAFFLRVQAESREANSSDLPFLISPRKNIYTEADENGNEVHKIDSTLPQNPATLPAFVGRTEVIAQLWEWLFSKRDSRHFLYGDAGSGKTTIAYEFATLVIENGFGIPNYNDYPIDQVIMLSAKQRELDPIARTIVEKGRTDFQNATELFQHILVMSGFHDYEKVENLDYDALVDELEKLFDATNLFLIIDDIDTLTTQKEDSGAEVLADLLSRSKSGSKALYTLRTLPALAIRHSINIPGLDRRNEYEEFIQLCCRKFDQEIPNKDIMFGLMEKESDRRPLVLEVIVGLRRTSRSYEDAIEAYKGAAGDAPRAYMFEREYNSLINRTSKWILAALYLFDKPITINELKIILRLDEEILQSGLSEISDFFLATTESADDGGTEFSLSPLAHRFISTVCDKLDFFEAMKMRVSQYLKGPLKYSVEVADISERALKMLKHEPEFAYEFLFERPYRVEIMERPDFRSLRGYVAARQAAPNINVVRDEMKLAMDIGAVDPKHVREWFYLEKNGGSIKDHAVEICDRVVNGRGYRNYHKAEFASRKGFLLALLAKTIAVGNSVEAIKLATESIKSNLIAFELSLKSKRGDPQIVKERTEKSIYTLLNLCIQADDEKSFYDSLYTLIDDGDFYWDPLLSSFKGIKAQITRGLIGKTKDMRSGNLNRIKGVLKKKKVKCSSESIKQDVLSEVDNLIALIN